MLRRNLLILIFVFVAACKTTNKPIPTPSPDPDPDPVTELKELMHFAFDESTGNTFKDLVNSKSLTASNKFNGPERINGVSGLALRTNGYYGWGEGQIGISMPENSITISGWVALASYPIHRKNEDSIDDDTVGAIFSNHNIAYDNGIALGINQHGKIVAHYDSNGVKVRMRSSEVVPLYKWNHITFTVNAQTGDSRIYLNSVLVKNATLTKGSLDLKNNYTAYLGKGSKNKLIGSVPTNGLNGAIDEVKLWNKAMSDLEVKNEYQSYTNVNDPDLSIPNSRFEEDYYRPLYHLTPSAGWTNETHGLFYKDNQYNIFSQRNLNAVLLEHINWGRYTSPDLLHWTEQKQVLWPEPGFDEVGIWSGHAIIKDEVPFLFYTGVNKVKAAIGIATPNDENLISWKKSNSNPVIQGAPASISNKDFRDPFVFKYQGDYYMIIGTGLNNGGEHGGLFLYKCSNGDFTTWDFKGTLMEGNPNVDGSGIFWEMPVYADFGNKQIILINKLPDAMSLYWTGSFNGLKFVKDYTIPKKLEAINHLLSPTINKDKNGNLVAIGIVPDLVGGTIHANQGWGHTFSLPRVWTLENDEIHQKPHPDIKTLRSNARSFSNLSFGPSSDLSLGTSSGRQLEIEALIDPVDADRIGFELYVSGAEKCLLYYDFNTQQFVVDKQSTLPKSGYPKEKVSGHYSLTKEVMKWDVFIDNSILEVFINDKIAFSTRVYTSSYAKGVDLYATGGNALAQNVTIYDISLNNQSSTSKNLFKSDKFQPSLKIYPNPTSAEINLNFQGFNSLENKIFIQITNLAGQLYFSQCFPYTGSDIKLDLNQGLLSGAPSGIYVVRGLLGRQGFSELLLIDKGI